MVTLEDIAREFGVSHSTVSRALAGSPLISAKTREQIVRHAEKVGYEVNQVARNLKTRSTKTVGLIVPEVSNPYYPKLTQLIADKVSAAGYALHLHLSGANQTAEAPAVSTLRSHRVDGLMIVTGDNGLVAREQALALRRGNVPLVVMGWIEDAEELDLVAGDDAEGGYLLATHLLDLGHRNIAVIGKKAHRGKLDRLYGFQKTLSEASLGANNMSCLEAVTETEVDQAVDELLKLPIPPTAIFGYQDSIAALVYRALRVRGIAIPTEMTVVGFDDVDLARHLWPALTTVGGHIEPLADSLVSLLLARIQDSHGEAKPQQILVSPRLIVRESSCPPQLDLPITTH